MPTIGFHARGRDLAESIANTQRLEAAGIDSVWVGDSSFDAYVHCAALAASTSTIKLGTAVTLLTRSPLAAMHASQGLDDLSGGRFTLGIGVGPNEWNRDWHGINPDRPVRRVREYLQCFKAAWDSGPDQPAEVDGDIYSIHGYQRARRTPSDRLDVLVGVVGPMNTRIAAQYGDGVIYDIELPHAYLKEVGTPALEEGLRRAGKQRDQIRVGGLFAVSVDHDPAAARRRARYSILMHVPVHYYIPVFDAYGFGEETRVAREALAKGDTTAAVDALSDEMVEAVTLTGTPDEVRRKVNDWSDVVDFMIVSTPSRMLPPDEAAHAYEMAIETFAR